jgi:hypothetical protein
LLYYFIGVFLGTAMLTLGIPSNPVSALMVGYPVHPISLLGKLWE